LELELWLRFWVKIGEEFPNIGLSYLKGLVKAWNKKNVSKSQILSNNKPLLKKEPFLNKKT